MKIKKIIEPAIVAVITFFLGVIQPGVGGELYDLGAGLESRSISFENSTGA